MLALPTLTRDSGLTKQYEQLKLAAARARLPFDRDVYLNVAFYLDEQYVEWASDASTIRQIPKPEGYEDMPRPVANKIMHFAAQEHSMTLRDHPTVDVLPATDDPIDASEASVSLAYCKWLADQQVADYEGELSDATLWALVGGEGFLKHTFDAKEGRGDIMSVSPLDLYSDPYVKNFSKARYAIHSQFMDVEQVYELYGKEIKAGDVQSADPMKTALLRDMGSAPTLSGVMVNELWYRPCRRHPKGIYVVWAGKDILYGPSDYPYAHNRLPFVQIGSIVRPGSYHYTCAIKYLRAPQMELNQYHAQRIMIRKNFANLKWWLPPGLELEYPPDQSPHQILTGHGGSDPQLKPEIIAPPNMPMGDEGSWIVDEMMHTVGIHEVSQGQVPGRVESARAIETLQNSDDGRLQEMRRTIKKATAEGFWMQLQLAKQFVKEDLLVSTYSRDGIQEVKKFKGSMVSPGLRVTVSMTSGLSGSRVERENKVMQWLQLGLIQDPAVVAEMLDMPMGQLNPDNAAAIRLARNENMQMAEAVPITPNSWDNHAVHLKEHNRYRMTSEYQALSIKAKQIFEYHCEQHDVQEIAEMRKLLEKQMLAQGMAAQGTGQAPPPEAGAGPEGAPAEAAA